MAKRIIYPRDSGGITVIAPTGELPIESVAAKDVPQGKPYLIIDANDLPAGRSERTLWDADFTDPDGYGGI